MCIRSKAEFHEPELRLLPPEPEVAPRRAAGKRAASEELQPGHGRSVLIHLAENGHVVRGAMLLKQLHHAAFHNVDAKAQAVRLLRISHDLYQKAIAMALFTSFRPHDWHKHALNPRPQQTGR